MIKNVIFDIGNVLVDFRWREIIKDLGLSREIEDRFETSVFGSQLWHEYDHGLVSDEEVYEQLKETNKEYLDAFERLWEKRGDLVIPYDYSVPWIKTLKREGLGVYLLSNYPKNLFTMHEESGLFPFVNHVDGKVVSGFVKKIKPDADIYEELLQQYGLKAKECIFIDDRAENVEAAKALGMEGIVFTTYEEVNKQLREYI